LAAQQVSPQEAAQVKEVARKAAAVRARRAAVLA
jgi:hypothetical protein